MKNIVLIGFMGTGKTSIGRLLAARLNRPFIDVDKKIETESKMSIGEIFEKHGENYFRQIESDIIARVSRRTNMVIATGGGTVLRRENRVQLMKNGIIIALAASVDAIEERTAFGKRPLLEAGENRREIISALLEKRASFYEQADYIVDTSVHSPHYAAEKIIVFLREGGYLRGRSFD
jgi:shikimate kinase